MDTEKALSKLEEWMGEEVDQAELHRRTGYSTSYISLVFNRRKPPSVDFIAESALALGHKKEEILRIAKWLPPAVTVKDPEREELDGMLEQLPKDEVLKVRDFAKYQMNEVAKRKKNKDVPANGR